MVQYRVLTAVLQYGLVYSLQLLGCHGMNLEWYIVCSRNCLHILYILSGWVYSPQTDSSVQVFDLLILPKKGLSMVLVTILDILAQFWLIITKMHSPFWVWTQVLLLCVTKSLAYFGNCTLPYI